MTFSIPKGRSLCGKIRKPSRQKTALKLWGTEGNCFTNQLFIFHAPSTSEKEKTECPGRVLNAYFRSGFLSISTSKFALEMWTTWIFQEFKLCSASYLARLISHSQSPLEGFLKPLQIWQISQTTNYSMPHAKFSASALPPRLTENNEL